jgi:hypothetical protein
LVWAPLEVDAGSGQEVDRVLRVDVRLQGELEVELVGADVGRQLALLVGEGEAQLDDLEQIDVGPDRLVVVVGGRLEVGDGLGDDAGELSVLSKRGRA